MLHSNKERGKRIEKKDQFGLIIIHKNNSSKMVNVFSTTNIGCVGRGKTSSKLVEGGMRAQTFPTIAGHIRKKSNAD